MLYLLLPPLADAAPYLGVLNVTRYITFRTAAASLTALTISLVLGPWLIRRLREFQIGQVIRQEGPQSHRAKAGARAVEACELWVTDGIQGAMNRVNTPDK